MRIGRVRCWVPRDPRPTRFRAALSGALLVCLCLAASDAAPRSAVSATTDTARSEVSKSLLRIYRFDGAYNAVIALDAEGALSAASEQDALPPAERESLPLAGIPVLLKDNIEMRGLPTTAGSLALSGNTTGRDAPLVSRLRAAGALLLGKANLSEWANFRSEHSISGWSAVGGQTRNAIDRERSPCGSSSGSAVAVALGYVRVAIGTETNGSIVCPAAVNGVVGFKPTVGLVSQRGIIPIASSQDTAGPIADTTALAALTLASMIDTASSQDLEVATGLRDYAGLASLRGKRIGVLTNTLGFDTRRDRALADVLAIAKADGAVLITDLSLTPYPEFNDDAYAVLLYEFKRDIAAYFASLDNAYRDWDLARLIAFNTAHAGTELALFDQGIFEQAETLSMSEADYQAARSRVRRATREDGLDSLFAAHDLDALIGITVGPAWVIDRVNGDAFFGPSLSSYPAVAGNPHITLPLATLGGLPLGISLVAERHDDDALASLAYRLEQVALERLIHSARRESGLNDIPTARENQRQDNRSSESVSDGG